MEWLQSPHLPSLSLCVHIKLSQLRSYSESGTFVLPPAWMGIFQVFVYNSVWAWMVGSVPKKNKIQNLYLLWHFSVYLRFILVAGFVSKMELLVCIFADCECVHEAEFQMHPFMNLAYMLNAAFCAGHVLYTKHLIKCCSQSYRS